MGAIGFLDFISKLLLSPATGNMIAERLDTEVSFLSLFYVDMVSAGMGVIAGLYLESVILLNSFLWIVFFVGAYIIRREHLKKGTKAAESLKDSSSGSADLEVNTSNTSHDKISQNNKLTTAAGLIALAFGLLVLFRMLASTSISVTALLFGVLFAGGGLMLLREGLRK